jgi:hypothetical protein
VIEKRIRTIENSGAHCLGVITNTANTSFDEHPPSYGDIPAFITQALLSMMSAGAAFACQLDAADYGGYGRLDMFDVNNNSPKPQYYAIANLIQLYRPK